MDNQTGRDGFGKSLLEFIRLTRPLFLLGVAVVYALGAGIASYLGVWIDWKAYWLGQAWVTLLQLSTQYFNEYYNAPADLINPNRTFLTGGSGALGPGKLPRRVALIAALVCLAFLASVTVLVYSQLQPPPGAYLIMGLAFLGAFFYSNPPVSLEASGYGELTTSVMVGFMVPAYAFILQYGEMHRLVAMCSFPLVAAHMAMLLAFDLPDYSNDMKFEKRTLMIRLGWQNGMLLHNVLILTIYLLILVARALGLPSFVVIAGLLTLPVGLFQIWQMRGIANGARVNWNALTIGAVALFASLSYLLAFAFWTQ
jgi:1,4-dihydroxy-2-naphthoate octaprenyltransferase